MNFHMHIPKFQLFFKKVAEIPNKEKQSFKNILCYYGNVQRNIKVTFQ